ncbi:hypothetical protein M9Y10_019056 [Tritrichomonas musculus]|uniref:Spt20-like SEP domain-containing protein n=1 Tax=Tritrichomonas musculus TaxID=1915356 RepID=A0ABR2GJV4_9EUKA
MKSDENLDDSNAKIGTEIELAHEKESSGTSDSRFLSEYFDNANTIINQLKTMTLGAILCKNESSFQFSSKYEKMLLNNYKNRMGVYISCLFDPQFDIFTPPRKGFLNDYDVNLFFEFYEPQFKIISKVKNGISAIDLAYELNILPVLECLETGVVSKELFSLLEKMKYSNWDDGVIIAKCTDFRLQPKKEFLIKLTAGPELIWHLSNIMFKPENIREKLEFEKQALLLQNPKLCSDPSQDIARIYSDIDWRKKIWRNHYKVHVNTMTRHNSQENHHISTVSPIDCSHQPNLDTYQNDFDSIFKDCQI